MALENNDSMGGISLANIFIQLYQTKIITKKRWYLKLIFHCLDISNVNVWLLYRRHCKQLQTPKNKQLSLRKFIARIETTWKMKDKDKEKRVDCPKRSLSPTTIVIKKLATPRPVDDVRFDGFCHMPKIRPKQK